MNTELKFETMRAKAAVDACQKQFDEAVHFCGRMASELDMAVKNRWDVQCPANNLSNAAAQVAQISQRLQVLLDSYDVLRRIDG